jgi:hypothetical protein
MIPLWFLFTIFSAQAFSDQVLTLNDLQFDTENDQYSVTGSDPYFTFKAQQNIKEGSIYEHQYLILEIELNQNNTTMQLFFKEQKGGYNPQYMVEFTALQGSFALKLPKRIDLNNAVLRLDLEQCQQCQFSFGNSRIETQASNIAIVEASKIKNGSVKISKQESIKIPSNSWSLNDLSGTISTFSISGNDPFIASSILDISTQDLGGVYFKLESPKQNNKNGFVHSDFQLFYATENNTFSERYSSVARLNSNDNPTHEIELFFPLDYLNLETPKDQILKKIRLDLPIMKGNWSLKNSKLIHLDELQTYTSMNPIQLLQKKRQRLRGLSLAKKVLSNIWADTTFSIGFLLLLLLVSALFIRSFRR